MKNCNLYLLALFFSLASFAGVKINGEGVEFSTIQDAVTNANNGDVLIVTTGVFAEAVDVNNKNITIDGGYCFDYSNKFIGGFSIIDPPNLNSCIDVDNSKLTLIDIELTGAKFNYSGSGGGLDIRDNSYVTAINCKIHDCNVHDYGGGIYLNGSHLILSNSCVYNCVANYGGGVNLIYGNLLFLGNAFVSNNLARYHGGGLILNNASYCCLSNDETAIKHNNAQVGGGAAVYSGTLSLRNGADIIENTASDYGGGIVVKNSNLNIFSPSNYISKINNNIATNHGGGMSFVDNATALIEGNVEIADNKAKNGAGIYITNGCQITVIYNDSSIPRICSNAAGVCAGAILSDGPASKIYLTNVFVADNTAQQLSGALYLNQNSEISAVNVKFLNNFAQWFGAVFSTNSKLSVCSDFNISQNTNIPPTVFEKNTATNYAGIAAFNSEIDIYAAYFHNNNAHYAGAFYANSSSGVLVNLVVARNSGGGFDGLIFDNNKQIQLLQSTVVNNSSNGIFQTTNGIPVTLKNCIVWGQLNQQVSPDAVVTYSDIQNGFAGSGNITNYPMFVDEFADDYRLLSGSPAIDSGYALTNITKDCIGNPRPYLNNWDMGAYEFVPEPCCFFLLICSLFCFGRAFYGSNGKK